MDVKGPDTSPFHLLTKLPILKALKETWPWCPMILTNVEFTCKWHPCFDARWSSGLWYIQGITVYTQWQHLYIKSMKSFYSFKSEREWQTHKSRSCEPDRPGSKPASTTYYLVPLNFLGYLPGPHFPLILASHWSNILPQCHCHWDQTSKGSHIVLNT